MTQENRFTYLLPTESLEDWVWNTIIARTNNVQPPPKRRHVIQALCDRDRHEPFDPDVVDAVVDDLIKQGVIEETKEGRLRIVSHFEE